MNRPQIERWVAPLLVSAGLLGVLLFLFPYNSGDSSLNSPLGISLWNIWNNKDSDTQDHSYCLLVGPMLAYLIYEKRREIVALAQPGQYLALVPIVLGLALFWLGSRAGKQYVGCGGIQLLVLGLICWFWGVTVFRRMIFAWGILAFLDTAVAFPLRMIVSTSAGIFLNLVGIATIRSGTALYSAASAAQAEGVRFQIDVADPCSGLHSLLPLLMFSAFYCYFFLRRPWHRWAVFLSAFVFTIVGNVVRIVLLVLGCLLWGSAFAIGTNDEPSRYHEGCGFFVFVVVLGLECLLGWYLARRDAKAPPAAQAEPPSPRSIPPHGAVLRNGAIAGFAALMLVVYLVTPPVYLPAEAGVVMSLPTSVTVDGIDGGHFYGTPAEVSEPEHRLLPKDTEFERKNYDDFHDHDIFFSIVLSGVQQYTIHPPEICLRAQGWDIVGGEDVPVDLISGHRMVVRNLSLERDVLDKAQARHRIKAYYMYWYVAENMTTPSHLERNVMSSWDRIFHNRDHRWAYVIAMSLITDSFRPDGMNAAQTKEMLTNFIRQVVPTIQKDEITATAHNP